MSGRHESMVAKARDPVKSVRALEAAAALGWTLNEELFIARSPSLFRPKDYAWCAARVFSFNSIP